MTMMFPGNYTSNPNALQIDVILPPDTTINVHSQTPMPHFPGLGGCAPGVMHPTGVGSNQPATLPPGYSPQPPLGLNSGHPAYPGHTPPYPMPGHPLPEPQRQAMVQALFHALRTLLTKTGHGSGGYMGSATHSGGSGLAAPYNRFSSSGSAQPPVSMPHPYMPAYGYPQHTADSNDMMSTALNPWSGMPNLDDASMSSMDSPAMSYPYWPMPNPSVPGRGYRPNNTSRLYPPIQDTSDLLNRTGVFPTLDNLLDRGGLSATLTNLEAQTPLLVFAPTEQAFDRLLKTNPRLFQQLKNPQNVHILNEILKYHVSQASRQAFTFPANNTAIDSLTSRDAIRYTGNAYQGNIMNGNQLVTTGRALKLPNNTLIIPIDDVLIPPGLDLSRLV
jgi:uncharacterized surface protein with fasciclin (FAS1) repeats